MTLVRVKFLVLIAGLIFLANIRVFAQTQATQVDSSNYFNPVTDDITKRLPPLEVLIDSASYNSPDVRYETLKEDYYAYTTLSAKRAWLNYFSLNWDANFGRWDFWDQDTYNLIGKYFHSWSWRSNYAVGFYIRLPILAIVDRRNQINQQKKWIEISMMQKEINRRFLATQVITYYNNLVEYQNYIKIYNKYQNFTMMQMTMAQNEFLNSEISVSEYTRLEEIQTRGAINFQQAIAQFNNAYQLLQVATGMKFNLINILH